MLRLLKVRGYPVAKQILENRSIYFNGMTAVKEFDDFLFY